jgi:hypothetical protein
MKVVRTTLIAVGTLVVIVLVFAAAVVVVERATAHPGKQPIQVVTTETR